MGTKSSLPDLVFEMLSVAAEVTTKCDKKQEAHSVKLWRLLEAMKYPYVGTQTGNLEKLLYKVHAQEVFKLEHLGQTKTW